MNQHLHICLSKIIMKINVLIFFIRVDDNDKDFESDLVIQPAP